MEALLLRAITDHRHSLLLELNRGAVTSLATTLEVYADKLEERRALSNADSIQYDAHSSSPYQRNGLYLCSLTKLSHNFALPSVESVQSLSSLAILALFCHPSNFYAKLAYDKPPQERLLLLRHQAAKLRALANRLIVNHHWPQAPMYEHPHNGILDRLLAS